MKKSKILIVVLMMMMLVAPLKTMAETKYKTLDFEKTLADEELEKEYDSYKPDKNAITIYLFRGKGCSFCRAFLSYMNSITNEYGKYFKLESYEVWKDQNNNDLMVNISNFLGKPASGVPYIIIGDQVFPGFNAEAYGEGIKNAIKTLFDTEKSKRYDVMAEYKKSLEAKDEENKTDSVSSNSVILWNCIIVVVATVVVLLFVNNKFIQLEEKVESLSSRKYARENKYNDDDDEEPVVRKRNKNKKG